MTTARELIDCLKAMTEDERREFKAVLADLSPLTSKLSGGRPGESGPKWVTPADAYPVRSPLLPIVKPASWTE